MRRLVLATGNPGKVRELRRLLAGIPFQIVSAGEDGIPVIAVEEDGATYAENATKKARAYAQATGSMALADDSGIEVDALGGRPGVHSARYGGGGLDDAGRTALLLQELADVPAACRTARYRAVVAVASPAGGVQTFAGTMEGHVGFSCRGERGFGYDPVFELEDGRTAAELSDAEKDAASHRGEAVRAAAAWLRSVL